MPRSSHSRASATGVAKSAAGQARAIANQAGRRVKRTKTATARQIAQANRNRGVRKAAAKKAVVKPASVVFTKARAATKQSTPSTTGKRTAYRKGR